MSTRGTGALILVLAALASYLWLFEVRPRVTGKPTATAAVEAPPLLAAPETSIVRLEVEDSDGRLTAVRRDGGWVDSDGRPWPARVVPELVEALTTLRPLMVVEADPADPADYGLGDPATRVRLVGVDGRPLLHLEVGERNPAWTGIYARVAGSHDVLLVGALLHWELEKLRDSAPVTASEP
jgi:hypothetical protein